MQILDGNYVTDEYYAWLEAEKEKERLRQKYRQLRSNLQEIQNKITNLKANLKDLEKKNEGLLKIDEEIFNEEDYKAIKEQINKVTNELGITISKVSKEC